MSTGSASTGPALADPAPELEPGRPERASLAELVGARLGQLQHELERVALDRGARDDPGARDAQALLAPRRARSAATRVSSWFCSTS